MVKKMGVGIIGLGAGGELHLRACRKNPHLETVAVCDSIGEKARKVAEKYNIPYFYTNYTRMLKQDNIEIIIVASPDCFHAEQSIAALETGKHVIVEKPMTNNIADCEKIIQAVEKSQRKLIVNQICRFNPRFMEIKKRVDKGILGELFYVEADYRHNIENLIVKGWRGKKENYHTPFLGGGCHAIDLLRWIVGEISEVYAYGSKKCIPSRYYPFDDCMVSVLKFRSGVVGKSLATFGCKRPYFLNLFLYGTKGTFENDRIYQGKDEKDYVELGIPIDPAHPFEPLIDSFVDCILNDTNPLIDVYDGANTVAAAIAACESIELKKPVSPVVFRRYCNEKERREYKN